MNNNIFSKRLKAARISAGLSLRGLSDKVNRIVSHNAISRYEKGEMMPDSKSLIPIAKALNVSVNYLFRAELVGELSVDFRKHSNLSKKEQYRITSLVQNYLEKYIEAATAMGVEYKHRLSPTSIKAAEEAIECAKKFRKKHRLGNAPIMDLTAVLEEAGILVSFIEASEKFNGVCLYNKQSAAIAVNKRFGAVRKRFTLAHELGHLLMDLSDVSEKEEENLCHTFAGALLLPPEVLKKAIGSHRTTIYIDELKSIKEEYGISIQAIGRQLFQHNIISRNRYDRFNILISKNGWRRNEPGSFSGEEKPQIFNRLILRALATEAISISKASDLLGKDQDEIMKLELAL